MCSCRRPGSAMIGAVMLGLGRALGETMAVTFVIGNANRLSLSIFDPGSTIASRIANEFNEASGLQLNALIALGCILFLVTFAVLVLARLLIARVKLLMSPAMESAPARAADRRRRPLGPRAPQPPRRGPCSEDHLRAASRRSAPSCSAGSCCMLLDRGHQRPLARDLHRGHARPRQRGRRHRQRHRRQPRADASSASPSRRRSACSPEPTSPSTARAPKLANVIRFLNDILLSAPVDPDRPLRLHAAWCSRWAAIPAGPEASRLPSSRSR